MKHLIRKILCLLSLPALFCACGQAEDMSSSQEELHLYDYEQTPYHLSLPESTEKSGYQPLNHSPQYAMWFTANDYPEILMTQTEETFTERIEERFDNAAAMGINTVYVQVRAFGDAYYQSELFSPGLYTPGNMDFDPLEIMIQAAHARELSIHAWINPLRTQSDVQMQEMDDRFPLKQWYMDKETNGTYISLVNDRWWLCPAYPEVRKLIAEGAAEIVRNYEVDGIHIDDYFYPTTDTEFDAEAFAESKETNLTEFRMEQCSQMVSEIYEAIKKENPEVLFGISPQGTLHGNEVQYADIETWCSEPGYCDYIVPQIYFGLKNENAPFAETATLWRERVTNEDLELIIGLCTYKMGQEDKYAGSGREEWITDSSIPSKELALVQEMGLGAAIYSYDSTFAPDEEIQQQMANERKAIQALLE
ncbi:MAG: family 10 glycosylhydrolase [Ruminococcus sp.]|nr:family 10 glycosylhydrolase [Ruminococcus sp.]